MKTFDQFINEAKQALDEGRDEMPSRKGAESDYFAHINSKMKANKGKRAKHAKDKFSPALIKKAIAIANSPKYKDYYSGAYRAIEKLKPGLEDHPKVLAALKAANESNESIKEAFKVGDFVSVNTGPHKGEKHEIIHVKDDGGYNVKPAGKSAKSIKYKLGAASAKKSQVSAWKESVDLKEAPGDYKKFFQATLKKFGVKSPAELDDKKKEEFFNYIAKTWDGENEGVEMWPAGYGKHDIDELSTKTLQSYADKAWKNKKRSKGVKTAAGKIVKKALNGESAEKVDEFSLKFKDKKPEKKTIQKFNNSTAAAWKKKQKQNRKDK